MQELRLITYHMGDKPRLLGQALASAHIIDSNSCVALVHYMLSTSRYISQVLLYIFSIDAV